MIELLFGSAYHETFQVIQRHNKNTANTVSLICGSALHLYITETRTPAQKLRFFKIEHYSFTRFCRVETSLGT